jgi:hypothetical protein
VVGGDPDANAFTGDATANEQNEPTKLILARDGAASVRERLDDDVDFHRR